MLIDTHVNLSRYPTRRLRGDEPAELVQWLRQHDVTQAWAGSFDGLLHKDIAGVNARLTEACARHGEGLLVPFGSVNILLPGWEEDVRRCHEVHKMPGIRLHPGYHGYELSDPLLPKLLEMATRRKLIVQIVLNMEDERTQHRLLRVPAVVLNPLPELLAKAPEARLVVANFRGSAPAVKLPKGSRVVFDTGMTESVEGVKVLAKMIGAERVVLGSHAPFYYLEAAILKMREANLDTASANAILFENARNLMKW